VGVSLMSKENQAFQRRQIMLPQEEFEIFSYSDTYLKAIDYHHHDFYEIYFLVSGKVSYIINGTNYQVSPGNIILISPDELHQPIIHEPEKPYKRVVLWISGRLLERMSTKNTDLKSCFLDSESHTNLLTPNANEQSRLLRLFQNLLESYYEKDKYGNDILKNSYLSELLVYINTLYMSREKGQSGGVIEKNKLILDILDYIDQNVENEISLDDLSAMFFLSKYHLCREFKKHMGTTLHRYIIQKRLVYAKNLIAQQTPLSQVSSKCGFSDYSNFFKSFKNEYGISPKEFYNTVNNLKEG
jgi:AraC-like DNA-binding protein